MVRGIQIWSTNFGVAQNSIERFVPNLKFICARNSQSCLLTPLMILATGHVHRAAFGISQCLILQ